MATTTVREHERLAPAEAGQLAVTWNRFRRHRLGLIGLFTLLLLISSVIVIPIISGYGSDDIDAESLIPDASGNIIKPALWSDSLGNLHILGTDEVGRDNLTRLFDGGRISLSVGILTTIIVVLIGSLVGALAGFYGGWV